MSQPKTIQVVARGFIAWAFAIALGLLFFLVLHVVSAQITPPPGVSTEPYPDVSTQELCEAEGGRWIEGSAAKGVRPAEPVIEGAEYCQGPLTIDRERELQYENYRQTALFVFAIGGALAVAGALMVEQLRPVAPGLMIGGIAAFLRAGFHVWSLAPGLGRLLTIVAVFTVLVFIGMRVFGEPKSSK